MAQLRRAEDGHFYIIAGQSQGTWQIDEAGIQWLKSNRHPMPTDTKNVKLRTGTYQKLKDKGFLFTKGWSSEQHDAQIESEDISELVDTGLPLLLQWNEQQKTRWVVSAVLSEFIDDNRVGMEIRKFNAKYVILKGSQSYTPIPIRNLFNTFHRVNIFPRARPYQIFWQDDRDRQYKSTYAPLTPGFNEGWEGNIFLEWRPDNSLWKLCLSNSTISFSGTALWLAKVGQQPEWPGKTTQIGLPIDDWQLWHLDVDEDTSIAWKTIKRWFSYRDIAVVPLYQKVHIINPMGALASDGNNISVIGAPVFIEAIPSSRQIDGVIRNIKLASIPFSGTSPRKITESQISSVPISTEQTSYFRWHAPKPGQYRIRLKGDASTKPLDIYVNQASPKQLYWLKGLTCTVQSPQQQQKLWAFSNSSDANKLVTPHRLTSFTRDELATLTWLYEPANLPVRVNWRSTTAEKQTSKAHWYAVQEGAILTQYWREHIWPASADSTAIDLILDAGSFGLLELQLLPAPEPEGEQDMQNAWFMNTRIAAQLLWYGQVIYHHSSEQVGVPVSLRHHLSQLRREVETQPTLYAALDRLVRAEYMSAWLLARIQLLIAEVQQYSALYAEE